MQTWTLAVATLAVAALTGAGAPAKAEPARDAEVLLSYDCRFPSGEPQRLDVRVRGAFPARATAGRPIRPERVGVTVTIPGAALADLDGGSVAGTVRLTTSVTQDGRSANAQWAGLTAPSAPVPDEADLVVAASGKVPPITPAGTGDLRVDAGALTVELSTAEPAKNHVMSCEPVAGQATALATVPVAAPTTAPAPGNRRAEAPRGNPAECGAYPVPNDDWTPGCVYMSGFANAAKLKGAAVLNGPGAGEPALTNMIYALTPDGNGAMVRQKFVRPLRSRSTFLTFGFMPTTATMEMTQRPLDPGNPKDPKDYGTFDAVSGDTGIQTVKAHMRMSIRILDVRVNGTPLDVGDRCRTRTDADIRLTGAMNSVLEPGMLEGAFTIPAFRGCGAGEDLDPLFNGSVSGPGNLLRVSLGASCIPMAEINCPPVLPAPRRSAAAPATP